MKKFKYKIAPYLKFLKHQRDAAVREKNKAEDFLRQMHSRYQQMENKMRKAYLDNSQFGKSIRDVHYINDSNRFISRLKSQMEDLSAEIHRAEEIYRMKFQKLVNLQREVEKIELHRETEVKKHKAKHKKLVQKQTDEINSTRQGRP